MRGVEYCPKTEWINRTDAGNLEANKLKVSGTFHVMKTCKRIFGWENAGVSLATPNIKDIKDHWVTE